MIDHYGNSKYPREYLERTPSILGSEHSGGPAIPEKSPECPPEPPRCSGATSYPWGSHPARRSPPTPPGTQPSRTWRSDLSLSVCLSLWTPPRLRPGAGCSGSSAAKGAPALLSSRRLSGGRCVSSRLFVTLLIFSVCAGRGGSISHAMKN